MKLSESITKKTIELEFNNGFEVPSNINENIIAGRSLDIRTGLHIQLDADEVCMFIPQTPYSQAQIVTTDQELEVHINNTSRKHLAFREGDLLGHLVLSVKTPEKASAKPISAKPVSAKQPNTTKGGK